MPELSRNLTGKKALVCGATQGIGLACAEALAAGGADLVLIARDETALRDIAQRLRGGGAKCEILIADFSEPERVRATVEKHIADRGPLHILINNTGGPKAGPILDATMDDFLNAFRMHVICNHLLSQALVPGMKAAGYGRIVNIVSTSVREPIPGLGVSNTTRAAVAGWAKTLARELAPFKITVNNVLPGYTSTKRLSSLIENRARAGNVTNAEIERQMIATTPAGRFADASEIAAAVAFLASTEAGYITGVSLPVDGGRIASI